MVTETSGAGLKETVGVTADVVSGVFGRPRRVFQVFSASGRLTAVAKGSSSVLTCIDQRGEIERGSYGGR